MPVDLRHKRQHKTNLGRCYQPIRKKKEKCQSNECTQQLDEQSRAVEKEEKKAIFFEIVPFVLNERTAYAEYVICRMQTAIKPNFVTFSTHSKLVILLSMQKQTYQFHTFR